MGMRDSEREERKKKRKKSSKQERVGSGEDGLKTTMKENAGK